MAATNARQLQCARLFTAKGYMPSGASALTGNFCIESGPALPTAFRTRNLDHGSNGLAQWRLGRLTGYMAFVKAKHPSATEAQLWAHYGRLDYQVDYVDIELKRDYPVLYRKLMQGGQVSALAADVCWQFERPNRALSHIDQRIDHAKAIFKEINPPSQPMTIMNALDAEADRHEQTAMANATAAVVSTGLGSAVVVHHVAPDLAWWEWTAIGLVAVIAIFAIANFVIARSKSRIIAGAKLDVDKTSSPAVVAPVAGAPAASADTTTKTDERAASDQAKAEEEAAIAQALAPQPKRDGVGGIIAS